MSNTTSYMFNPWSIVTTKILEFTCWGPRWGMQNLKDDPYHQHTASMPDPLGPRVSEDRQPWGQEAWRLWLKASPKVMDLRGVVLFNLGDFSRSHDGKLVSIFWGGGSNNMESFNFINFRFFCIIFYWIQVTVMPGPCIDLHQWHRTTSLSWPGLWDGS